MTAKHTPGPWRVSSEPGKSGAVITDKITICNCGYGADAEADARLIAKAPEMLEALRISALCGQPNSTILYDEEGVEGWLWTAPDGREWTAIGSWDEEPPPHPLVAAILEEFPL